MKRCLFLAAILILAGNVAAMACCFLNKDVHNNTGLPAWDIRMVFENAPIVLEHYNGYPDGWRFRQFSTWQANGRTYLRWFDPVNPAGIPTPIPTCSWVHIGYRLNGPAPLVHAWWTDEGGCPLPGGQIQQPSHWVFYENFALRRVTLRLVNDAAGVPQAYCVPPCPDPTIIQNIFYTIVPEELPLADLNQRNSQLMSMLMPLPGGNGPFVLSTVGSLVDFQIPEPMQVGQVLVYRLIGEGLNGFMDFGQHEMAPPTAVDPGEASGASIDKLFPSEPNPVLGSATIRYRTAEAGPVLLRIFDANGRLVRTLIDETRTASPEGAAVVWDGRNETGQLVGPGAYFYQLKTQGYAASRKLVLVKLRAVTAERATREAIAVARAQRSGSRRRPPRIGVAAPRLGRAQALVQARSVRRPFRLFERSQRRIVTRPIADSPSTRARTQ